VNVAEMMGEGGTGEEVIFCVRVIAVAYEACGEEEGI